MADKDLISNLNIEANIVQLEPPNSDNFELISDRFHPRLRKPIPHRIQILNKLSLEYLATEQSEELEKITQNLIIAQGQVLDYQIEVKALKKKLITLDIMEGRIQVQDNKIKTLEEDNHRITTTLESKILKQAKDLIEMKKRTESEISHMQSKLTLANEKFKENSRFEKYVAEIEKMNRDLTARFETLTIEKKEAIEIENERYQLKLDNIRKKILITLDLAKASIMSSSLEKVNNGNKLMMLQNSQLFIELNSQSTLIEKFLKEIRKKKDIINKLKIDNDIHTDLEKLIASHNVNFKNIIKEIKERKGTCNCSRDIANFGNFGNARNIGASGNTCNSIGNIGNTNNVGHMIKRNSLSSLVPISVNVHIIDNNDHQSEAQGDYDKDLENFKLKSKQYFKIGEIDDRHIRISPINSGKSNNIEKPKMERLCKVENERNIASGIGMSKERNLRSSSDMRANSSMKSLRVFSQTTRTGTGNTNRVISQLLSGEDKESESKKILQIIDIYKKNSPTTMNLLLHYKLAFESIDKFLKGFDRDHMGQLPMHDVKQVGDFIENFMKVIKNFGCDNEVIMKNNHQGYLSLKQYNPVLFSTKLKKENKEEKYALSRIDINRLI